MKTGLIKMNAFAQKNPYNEGFKYIVTYMLNYMIMIISYLI